MPAPNTELLAVSQRFLAIVVCVLLVGCAHKAPDSTETVRFTTYNVEDIRTGDLDDPSHPRLRKIAAEIAEIAPDIILINEIQFDSTEATGSSVGDGQNAEKFVDRFLAPMASKDYEVFTSPSNTGLASGFDLDNDGNIVVHPPVIPETAPDGSPGRQTPEGRAYGNDSFGFGMVPGQYGMALLVNKRYTVIRDQIRTFQHFKWSQMPDALQPKVPGTGKAWYNPEEWAALRLSSKSHWDVPVDLGRGRVVHILVSHPTPPAFDGPEMRNKFRNHDEIRFWGEYLADSAFLVDDSGKRGGLETNSAFVILGDLNADVNEGSSFENPVQRFLLDNERVNGAFIPLADRVVEELDDDDTAWWGLRVDYVLPSRDFVVQDGAVHRHAWSRDDAPTDHFPVWIDLILND